jgi:hypothetical protein
MVAGEQAPTVRSYPVKAQDPAWMLAREPASEFTMFATRTFAGKSARGVLPILCGREAAIRFTVLQNIITVSSFPFGAPFASLFY